jgi:CBS domain-containing protein
VTSIALGLVLLALGSVAARIPPSVAREPAVVLASLGPIETLLVWLGPINVLVGVFNLIPGFPLDGGRIFRSIVWAATGDLHIATRVASALGQAIGWGLVFLGIAMTFGASVPYLGRGIVGGVWLAFIGWFLTAAAAQTWRRQIAHHVLEGETVARVMRPRPPVVRPDTNLAEFVDGWWMRSEERAFAVVDEHDRIAGLVTLADVRAIPGAQWPAMTVGQAMTPAPKLLTCSPNEELSCALDKMNRVDIAQLPVLDRDRLVGMIRRVDIAKWIALHVQSGPGGRRYAH